MEHIGKIVSKIVYQAGGHSNVVALPVRHVHVVKHRQAPCLSEGPCVLEFPATPLMLERLAGKAS